MHNRHKTMPTSREKKYLMKVLFSALLYSFRSLVFFIAAVFMIVLFLLQLMFLPQRTRRYEYVIL